MRLNKGSLQSAGSRPHLSQVVARVDSSLKQPDQGTASLHSIRDPTLLLQLAQNIRQPSVGGQLLPQTQGASSEFQQVCSQLIACFRKQLLEACIQCHCLGPGRNTERLAWQKSEVCPSTLLEQPPPPFTPPPPPPRGAGMAASLPLTQVQSMLLSFYNLNSNDLMEIIPIACDQCGHARLTTAFTCLLSPRVYPMLHWLDSQDASDNLEDRQGHRSLGGCACLHIQDTALFASIPDQGPQALA